jgi:aryl-alcohol dehydrogenase-like predicted oxidoreductase
MSRREGADEDMQTRRLGKTSLTVSRLGAGLAEIGSRLTLADEARAARVLNTALDGGTNFLDTAACYGISEELIGRTIAHRRDDYILATKAGHVAGGYDGDEWTAQTITDSIERSLTRMATDRLDLVQLHSCGVNVLERGEVIQALLDARQAGKTRYIGYSGDNEAAQWAVRSGQFDTLQTSFSLVDQWARKHLLRQAKAKGMGIIAKRPIANGVWHANGGSGSQPSEYTRRAEFMARMGPIRDEPEDPILLALGFTLAHDEVDTAIVGTSNPDHMRANIERVETELPIEAGVVSELHRRFDQLGHSWDQRT